MIQAIPRKKKQREWNWKEPLKKDRKRKPGTVKGHLCKYPGLAVNLLHNGPALFCNPAQERGYDQSYLLARETCRHWSVAPETLLQKTKDNVAQSSLSSREERQKNVVGAYVAVNEDKIKGQRILLIDDILTTGATLREAARVLREAGAEKVICATLAAADED